MLKRKMSTKRNSVQDDIVLTDSIRLHEKWDKPGIHKKILDRHFTLLLQVQEACKLRKTSSEKRTLCEKLAWQHLEEFPQIRPILIEWGKDYASVKHEKESFYLPHVPTFEYLATILTEKGEYDKAIEVCELALAYGLQDQTKAGYKGRIKRIMRKKCK